MTAPHARRPRRRAATLLALATCATAALGLSACKPTPISSTAPCGRTTTPPTTYEHVVLLMEENRTWTGGRTAAVGMGFDATAMPFLHGLGTKCTYYTDWEETNTGQNSLNQYIGLTSGVANTATVNDCTPSTTCRSTDDNIFRQVRTAGGTPRTFVDGASAPCSVGTNAAKHIPALYYVGGNDQAACTTEVRPLADLDPNALPTFAMIVPDQCHDGHDCSDATVDAWAKQVLTPILDGTTYKAGKTLVVVVYDEDRPVPNLLIAPTAKAGAVSTLVGSHADLLKTVEEVLGLPVMDQGQLPTATSLRATAHL
ncbi:MAG: alkaline phosphatase family protein [Acidimicrobiales bacterium]